MCGVVSYFQNYTKRAYFKGSNVQYTCAVRQCGVSLRAAALVPWRRSNLLALLGIASGEEHTCPFGIAARMRSRCGGRCQGERPRNDICSLDRILKMGDCGFGAGFSLHRNGINLEMIYFMFSGVVLRGVKHMPLFF